MERDQDFAVDLAVVGLEDMSNHFILFQRPWCRYGITWIVVQLGREVRSWMEYILGTDSHLFRNVYFQDPVTTHIIT